MIQNGLKLLFICIFLVFNGLSAQLSGNYTIGGVTSGTNFASWSDFVSAYNTNGVSASVSIKVMSDLTTSSLVQFNQHSTNPTTSSNKIFIDGNGKKITGNLNYEVLSFNGADYFEIKKLNVLNSSSSSLAQGIRFYNGANYNVIDSCVVELTNLSSSQVPEGAYISFASNNTSLKTTTSSHNGIGNTIKNCILRTSLTGSPGPAYGIIDQQGTSTYSSTGSNNSFVGNKITNFYSFGIFARYVNGEEFSNNEISRDNANSNSIVDTTLTGISVIEAYASNNALVVNSNTIRDLPFKAASSSSSNLISNFVGCNFYNVFGTSKLTNSVDQNNIFNVLFYSSCNGISVESCVAFTLSKNKIYNLIGNYGSSTGIYCNSGADVNITENTIRKCDFGSSNNGNGILIYTIDVQTKYFNQNYMNGNVLDSNISNGEMYGLVAFYSADWDINRNMVTSNKALGSTSFFWGTYFYFLGNLNFNSNLIAFNDAKTENYSAFNLNYNTGYTSNMFQNTIYLRENNSGQNSIGFYNDEDSYISFVGNIVDMKGTSTAYPVYIYTTSTLKEVDNNTFNISGFSSEYWALGTTSFGNFSGWKSSSDVGPGERFLNPVFKDVAKYNFQSNCFENQNNVNYKVSNSQDVKKVSRNLIKNDRGAFENFMDLQLVKSDLNFSSQVCSGNERTIKLFIKNNFVDTAYNFKVAFTINGKLITETVTQKILLGDTGIYTFKTPLQLVKAGTNYIQLFLSIPDDKSSNDTLSYSVNVIASPGGIGFSATSKVTTPNSAIYQKSFTYDVTILGVPVMYNLNSPRAYSNSQYGSSGTSKWSASVMANTLGGKVVSGSSFTPPSGSTDLEFKFQTSDSTLEDSTILIKLKVTDLSTGCDTIYRRFVYIFPSPKLLSTVPTKNCLGDTLVIKNNSTYKKGYLDYFWSFGTGNSADTSNAIEPLFVYANSGNFNLSLAAKTKPYGFVFTKVHAVNVIAKPSVKFTKENTCIGNNLNLVNNTTPTNAIMTWDFGDGKGTTVNNNANIVIQYLKAGNYTIKLVADLLGCTSSLTQKVIVFDKPVPDFIKVSGTCDNEKVSFQNKTSLTSGNFGSKWDFDDNGKTSLDRNPIYTFSSSGTKKVKLIVLSEFGCKDSITKNIGIKESPKVAFTADQYCIYSKTVFQNITPIVAGFNASLKWYLDDGDSSTLSSISHSWKSIGKKTIALKVLLDNGCFSELSKSIDVLDQAIVKFSFDPKCSLDTVNFDNQSTGNGALKYLWNFGDNDTSNLEKPFHRYVSLKSKTFNVELVVILNGGCKASLIKQLDIYELPRTCDFSYAPDYSFAYYGAKLEPMDVNLNVGGQSNVDYNWTVKGLGNQFSKDLNAAVSYNLGGDGSYQVTMSAKTRDNGCTCSISKQIVMDRLNVSSASNVGIKVYPNPIKSFLNVKVENGAIIDGIEILNSVGSRVNAPIQMIDKDSYLLDFTPLSNGVYYFKYSIEGRLMSTQLVVAH
jgi:PKD repeat protein